MNIIKKANKTFIIIATLALLVACASGSTSSIEKEIVGTWISTGEKSCDTNMDDEISFYEDETISGIEGFKTYKIELTDRDDYDYAILSGGYEDTAKYRIKIQDDGSLLIVYEESNVYDFDSAIACHLVKK